MVEKTKIDEDYYIDSDSHQLILQKKVIVKTGSNKGKVSFRTISYRSKLEHILNDYLDIKVREGVKKSKDIKELINLIKELRKEIVKIMGGNNDGK